MVHRTTEQPAFRIIETSLFFQYYCIIVTAFTILFSLNINRFFSPVEYWNFVLSPEGDQNISVSSYRSGHKKIGC